MGVESERVRLERIQSLIHIVRGRKVMLDFDLATIYGVSTRRLNEQVRRNLGRFPADFAFRLSQEEYQNLMSHFATSSAHGGRRKVPYAFTEHGAVMLASVLNSPIAVQASIRVVRAFVRMRELLAPSRELAGGLAELERRLDGHDEAIRTLFAAIRRLLEPAQSDAPELERPRREIGFHVKDTLATGPRTPREAAQD